VLPNANGAEPVSFAPRFRGGPALPYETQEMMELQNAFFGMEPNEIRDRIIEGMQMSINAVCLLGAQPETITGRASAAGVVEIEATWRGEDICDAAE
jgi:hypothetical protein